jgi:hypothetical protein
MHQWQSFLLEWKILHILNLLPKVHLEIHLHSSLNDSICAYSEQQNITSFKTKTLDVTFEIYQEQSVTL